MNPMFTLDISKSVVLRTALRQLQANQPEAAHATLKNLIDNHLNPLQSPSDILYHVFASALAKRLSAEAAEEINLYLKPYERSQIDLFNFVAQQLPYVGEAGHVANNYLAQFMEGHEEVSLLDIGIGTGRQVIALLRKLESGGSLPRRITVYGIEPMKAALDAAEHTIRQECERLGVELFFHGYPIFVENISEEEFASFIRPSGCLCVNASFALHHIHGCEARTSARENTIRKIRALQPLAFVLSEPNSDHYVQDIGQRFENCWKHFETAFAFIDQLQRSAEDAIQLKMFFYREIEDIVGNREDSRFERHERVETWINRLVHAGFRVHVSEKAIEGIERHPLMRVALHQDFIGFDYRNETLVAVICGVPK
ncbi:GRAS family protein [Paenibacillus sp. MBLB4367]|uniref:GRAS family protein n=1 Tax=Paenibacillus sp. MBLB4367 TaxID=3384767 RepID=UPI0039083082